MRLLQVGEKGFMRPDLTRDIAHGNVGWVSSMENMRGKIVTISALRNSTSICQIEEDPGVWYCLSWIYPMEEPSVEEMIKKAEEERAEMIKNMRIYAEDVEKIAIDVFGKERVEITPQGRKEYYDIIIHFPIIQMTNTAEAEHTIKDLFVKVCVRGLFPDSEYKTSIEIHGVRTSMSVMEYKTNYSHSHLNVDRGTEWQPFCLGHSSFRGVRDELMKQLTEELWQMFFLSIQPFLSWESLEGGPYIRISNIVPAIRSVSSAEHEAELARVLPFLPLEVWEVNSEEIKLIPNHPTLNNFFNENYRIRESLVREVIDEEKERKRLQKLRKESILTFKGKKVPFIIYVEEKQETQTARKTLQPAVFSWITSALSEKSRNFTKKYEYVRRKNNSEHIFEKIGTFQPPDSGDKRQASEPDKVSA